MRKAFDGSLLHERAKAAVDKESRAIKCKQCHAVHPVKYNLKVCPVCGHTLVRLKQKQG